MRKWLDGLQCDDREFEYESRLTAMGDVSKLSKEDKICFDMTKAVDHLWRRLIAPLKYIHACTHTHTYTHVGFYGLRGLSIGVMVFILYKLYVLLPYTYPTPKLSPHRRRAFLFSLKKNSLCMIYKRFKLWGHWKCPHKSPSTCNTYVIPMSLYKFVSS